MSNQALNRTYELLPTLRDALQAVPAKRRPSYANCALVALLLADRLRPTREHVDETVPQIADTLALTETVVRSSLAALETIGWWIPERRGSRARGTLRRAALLPQLRGVSPTESLRGADPTQSPEELRGVATPTPWGSHPNSVGYTPELRGADPATPPTPRCNPHSSSPDDDDDRLIRAHLEAHIAHDPLGRITSPAALRRSEPPKMRAIVDEARELGDDPTDALEAHWPTRHPDDNYDAWLQEVG